MTKKLSQNQNERNKENESSSTTWVDPKTVYEPFLNPKNSLLGPPKVKNDPKIKSKSNVRIDGNKELSIEKLLIRIVTKEVCKSNIA